MPYENRLILYIDILGFTSDVKKSESTEEKYSKIKNTLEYIQGLFNFDTINGIEKLQFSDSLVISVNEESPGAVLHMISNASFAIHEFFENGYLCKGVLSRGKLFHKGDILFGPEFLKVMKAEALESFPRVTFNQELLEIARKFPTPAQIGYENVEIEYIMHYADQIEGTSNYQIAWYKDYGNLVGAGESDTRAHYEGIKNLIESNIIKFNNIRVLNKYLFVKHQFNNSTYLMSYFPKGISIKPSISKKILLYPTYFIQNLISKATKYYWKRKL